MEMSRLISWLHRARGGAARRVAILVAASALGVAGTLVLTGSSAAQVPAANSCSNATLHGQYIFAGDGWQVASAHTTPLAFAGSERFDGAGAVSGIATNSSNGVISPASSFTGSSTVAANCTGKLTINVAPGVAVHFDLYVAPSGDQFTYIQTDPGSVSATTEHRVAS
jgi:hypothetical protein